MFSRQELLKIINKEEGYEIEFKESLSGLKSEDIVAFANSKTGGVILIGVKDDSDNQGKQIGTVTGCQISDKDKLSILNKAQSCRPPVNLEIISTEIDGAGIYVIEILSGEFKPYCTDGGTYRIRGDGQKRSLYPSELLSLFMESERNKFVNSFKEATTELERNLNETKQQVLKETSTMIKELQAFDKKVSETLDDIYSSADNADSNSSNVESTVDDIEDTVDDIWRILMSVSYLLPRIDSIIKSNQNSNEFDPKKFIKESLSRSLERVSRNGVYSQRIIDKHVNIINNIFPEVSKQEIQQIIREIDLM
ncbi:AlbA family DNA-binding domain-containing protein [Paenibacillus solani]|uniref:AlbA family DNA-binding domain-containing protein n=1 Tax=Paenibacillus solani TaxID=1705565 RepID=UPI003D27C890